MIWNLNRAVKLSGWVLVISLAGGCDLTVQAGAKDAGDSESLDGGGDGGTAVSGNCVSHLAAGGKHACAVRTDGRAVCWGANERGQLGDGTTTSSSVPKEVTGLAGVSAIAAGTSHSCAVMSDGTLWCWGDFPAARGLSSVPIQVPITAVTDVALGELHGCARKSEGTVWCWGDNSNNQLGWGLGTSMLFSPAQVPFVGAVAQITSGHRHVCAKKADGTVWCWGDNSSRQARPGYPEENAGVGTVAGLTNVAQVAAGGSNTCAIKNDGSVWCWGWWEPNAPTAPFEVPSLSGASSVSVGVGHVCARYSDGSAKCVGNNTFGQLGNGSSSAFVATAASVTALKSVTQLATGGWAQFFPDVLAAHSCAMTDEGVYCWGTNSSGQLGDGTLENRPVPTRTSIACP